MVRPVGMYGFGNKPLKKAQEKKLYATEMKMLRWISGATNVNKIRHKRIRGTAKVLRVAKIHQIRRLQWYGHMRRRNEA